MGFFGTKKVELNFQEKMNLYVSKVNELFKSRVFKIPKIGKVTGFFKFLNVTLRFAYIEQLQNGLEVYYNDKLDAAGRYYYYMFGFDDEIHLKRKQKDGKTFFHEAVHLYHYRYKNGSSMSKLDIEGVAYSFDTISSVFRSLALITELKPETQIQASSLWKISVIDALTKGFKAINDESGTIPLTKNDYTNLKKVTGIHFPCEEVAKLLSDRLYRETGKKFCFDCNEINKFTKETE